MVRYTVRKLILARFFRPPQAARDAADFAVTYLCDESVRTFFERPEFARALAGIPDDSWDITAEKFREATGWDLKTSVIAASIARKYLAAHDTGKA